jgi:hypothetical protein
LEHGAIKLLHSGVIQAGPRLLQLIEKQTFSQSLHANSSTIFVLCLQGKPIRIVYDASIIVKFPHEFQRQVKCVHSRASARALAESKCWKGI